MNCLDRMTLLQVLRESFEMLKDEPKFFVPRLFSTTISTAWFILVFDNYLSKLTTLKYSNSEMIFYLVSGPLIVFMGVAVSIMLARMVDKGPELKSSFLYTVGRMKTLLLVTWGMLSLGILMALPLTIGIVLYPVMGIAVLAGSAALTVLMMIAVFYLLYFLPITLVENSSVVESIRDSISSSRENSKEVTVMLLFSFALLGVAGLAQGALEFLGYLAFAASRFISVIVTTYLFVVSPKLYLVENN